MKKLILVIAFIFLSGFAFAQNLDVIGDINTKGRIKINGNSGTAGQVLTSNGTSAPTWNNLTTANNIPSKALVTLNSNTNSTGRLGYDATTDPTQADSIDISVIRYNIGSDISIISTGTKSNRIILNSTGLYRIEGGITVFVQNSSASINPVASIELIAKIGGGTSNLSLSLSNNQPLPQIKFSPPFNFSKTIPFAFDYYFDAGDHFTFEVNIGELTNFPQFSLGVTSTGSMFSISKISN